MQLIEVKVRYVKETENGDKKKTTEKYLVDAMSFAEAEARITEEIGASHLEEFTVEAVRRSGFDEEYLNYIDNKYYSIKVLYLIEDEKTGVPTRKKVYYLVEAKSITDAISNAQRMIKDSVCDTTITEVKETEIMDVIMEE